MLRDKIARLALEVPETRVHLVPLLRKHASSCSQLSGGQRDLYETQVWDMFVKTYSRIGLTLSSSSQMYKYPIWDLCFDGGVPVAFTLFKKTGFGLKLGLAGSNGSSAGKRYTVDGIRKVFRQSGFYGEVSHKVESIALASGAPAVCAIHAGKVLGKRIEPESDGVHYTRNLKGVGLVTKILLGRPKGVPVTDAGHPACSIASDFPKLSAEEVDEAFDTLVHYACLMQD